MKAIFWNKTEARLRSFWRILCYLALVALLINPVILVLDRFAEQLLSQTTINTIVALGFFSGLWLFIRYIDWGKLPEYGILFRTASLNKCLTGAGLGMLVVCVIAAILYLGGKTSIEGMFFVSPEIKAGFILALATQVIRYLSGSIFEEIMSRAFLISTWPKDFVYPGGWM